VNYIPKLCLKFVTHKCTQRMCLCACLQTYNHLCAPNRLIQYLLNRNSKQGFRLVVMVLIYLGKCMSLDRPLHIAPCWTTAIRFPAAIRFHLFSTAPMPVVGPTQSPIHCVLCFLSNKQTKKTPWSLIRERTILTELPPLVDEI
jgi:hypothetical protein